MSREAKLDEWLSGVLKTPLFKRSPLAGDASFRRYFRVFAHDTPYVVMDAPPPEAPQLFIDIARVLENQGVAVPKILAFDIQEGFILLSDFGDRLYLNALTDDTANALYKDAFQALVTLQTCPAILPRFDTGFLQRQAGIFEEWYLKKHKNMDVFGETRALLNAHYELLFETINIQPEVFVHRDYHSRNLMIIDEKNPGILDFQDAMRGPITYDLVSLLQDCYISWPRARVVEWVGEYQTLAKNQGLLTGDIEHAEFLRWFDWTGLQRHLKNLGIFSRLYYRDNKAGYLKDIPLLLNYIQDTCQRYPQLHALGGFFENHQENAEA